MIPNSPAAWSARAHSPLPEHAACRWSQTGQQERFASVLAALDPQPGESLLDFGCGTGALSERLPIEIDYTGYDWAPGMLARARDEHPGRKFVPVLVGSLPYTVAYFDLIACVGPFNLPEGWSKTRTWATIEELWARCRRALAVCLYAGEDPVCLIYNEYEIPFWQDSVTVTRHRSNDLLLLMERT